jgi:ParB family chromosome partitioning protein
MASAVQKITLSASRDIPFDKLVLSQSNVRRVKAGVSIDELAEDIARRTLLQGLSVRPVLDGEGNETGMFEVPAGGRRYRALEILVKQKRLAKNAPIPCVVRDANADASAEEDSLAENIQRAPLHPLDQFRAFQALRETGLGEEEIAARFFVTPAVVKQRLRLASVSPKLLEIYAEDGMTLDQLMAFAVSSDHARQEQVWEAIARSYNREPYYIRRQLTEGAVRASDRRALFIGIEVYEAASGVVMRDLFQADDGGWLQDPALLDRLAIDKLKAEAETIAAESWKWIEIAIDFPYGHTTGLRRLKGEAAGLTTEEQQTRDALQAEYDRIEKEYAEADELPEAIDQRLGEIETALASFEERPVVYDPAQITRAGVFVSIDSGGNLRIERGYVRPEDEAARSAVETAGAEDEAETASSQTGQPVRRAAITIGGAPADPESDEAETDGIRPLSERLLTELTAHRTLALRDALANDPGTAFTAVLHNLCLAAFYRYSAGTCLEISAKSTNFGVPAPGLADSAAAKAIEERHEAWTKRLPEDEDALWEALASMESDSQQALFAHCASLSVNAVHDPWTRGPGRLVHANRLAGAVRLDMAAAGWRPTVDNYLGRVPKARILEAVREAKGEQSAQLIDHLKKADMAKEAERLLEGTGWLPEPLRTVDRGDREADDTGLDEAASLPDFLAGDPEDDREPAEDEEEIVP